MKQEDAGQAIMTPLPVVRRVMLNGTAATLGLDWSS